MKDRLKSINKKHLKIAGIVLLIFALPLTLILVRQVQNYRSSAAAPDKLETEGGVLSSSGVSKQNDSNASSGQYVLFNKASNPSPTTPPTGSNYLASCTALDKDNWPSYNFPPKEIAMPDYLKSTYDPMTGVKITRVSGAPGDSIPNTNRIWYDKCGPRYPKTPAWNADQSVLYTGNGYCEGGFLFFDAKDGPDQYQVLFDSWIGHHGRWHPKDPNAFIYINSYKNEVGILNINTKVSTVKYTATQSNFSDCGFGQGEGTVSDDGRHIVLDCIDSNLPSHTSTRPGRSFFVVDLVQGVRVSPIITSWEMPNFEFLDSAIISPSGKYIIAQQDYRKSITLGFDQDDWWEMHPDRTWGLGHFDVGYDAQGKEIAIACNGYMVNLTTGIKSTWLNVIYKGCHASNRNLLVPGWSFISNYRNEYYNLKPVFSGEIFATETKNGGLIRRIVHHRSSGSNADGSARYASAPMATSSLDGTRVFFRSDWGIAGGNVYGFVADIRNVCSQ